MKKYTLPVVVLVILVIGGALFYAFGPERAVEEEMSESQEVPGFVAPPDPLGGVSELNAVEKANPFKNIKTNPFE